MNADDMKPFAAILVLLALAGCSTDSRTPVLKPGSAIVRSVIGDVQYGSGGVWKRLRVNLELTNGTQIRTGHSSNVYLQVNGSTSTLKLEADTELDLEEMTGRNAAATRTALELRKGTVLGKVKKLSSESSFQVRGGGVTLEVRGGDFQMSDDGRVEAVNGEMTVRTGGQIHQLVDGQYFDPKKDEVGILPDRGIILYCPILPGFTNYPVNPFLLLQGSPALSPFQRGLENARHGIPASGD
jgi:FecR-like protein